MTKLELEILKWIETRNPEYGLSELIPLLEVTEREITKIGFFTSFKDLPVSAQLSKLGSGNINGPIIESKDASGALNDASTLLNISNGSIVFLEAFTLEEDGNANDITNYELSSWGLPD